MEVRVRSLSHRSVFKDLTVYKLQLQLGFSLWPGNVHVPQARPQLKIIKSVSKCQRSRIGRPYGREPLQGVWSAVLSEVSQGEEKKSGKKDNGDLGREYFFCFVCVCVWGGGEKALSFNEALPFLTESKHKN